MAKRKGKAKSKRALKRQARKLEELRASAKPKTWRDLKGKQKLRVTNMIFKEFERRYKDRILDGEFPKDQDEKIIGYIHHRLKGTTCWLRRSEVETRYYKRKAKYRDRILKRARREYLGLKGTPELIFLGTGNRDSEVYYNTCFAIRDGERITLIDCGGGKSILGLLAKRKIPVEAIHEVFVSGSGIEHTLGAVWFIRAVRQSHKKGKYTGKLRVYGGSDTLERVKKGGLLLTGKTEQDLFGDVVELVEVTDGQSAEVGGFKFTFFDLDRMFDSQLGFRAELEDGRTLVFLGDEAPTEELARSFLKDADWAVMEVKCLERDKEKVGRTVPRENTLEEACRMGRELNVGNLVLVNACDFYGASRQEVFTRGAKGRTGKTILHVPNERQVIPMRDADGGAG